MNQEQAQLIVEIVELATQYACIMNREGRESLSLHYLHDELERKKDALIRSAPITAAMEARMNQATMKNIPLGGGKDRYLP